MTSLIIISLLALACILGAAWEYQRHQNQLQQIPVRIHINGTRGKSSVSRLIGAGLRAGGLSTLTKVTGTFPRMILSDGRETAIVRKEKANILEQLQVIRFGAQEKIEVLILECMALKPKYQLICEHQMVKATHGVITNIRLDHLDVMGPTLDEVADALSGTIPKKAELYTSEDRCLTYLEQKAAKLNTAVHAAPGESVTDAEMEGFSYIEHKANVDLALKICESLGVDRAQALAAMKQTHPDEGVLTKKLLEKDQRQMHFYNALAANDPESSLMIWYNIDAQHANEVERIVLLNSRKDRQDRARQLVECIAENMGIDRLVLMGEAHDLVAGMARKAGIKSDRISLLESSDSAEQLEALFSNIEKEALVLALGNMGAGGAELAEHVEDQK